MNIMEFLTVQFKTGNRADKSEIDSFWWETFQGLFINSYGDSFETQRVLEKKSLEKTLLKFESTENADELGEKMFVHWRKSPIFEDAAVRIQGHINQEKNYLSLL